MTTKEDVVGRPTGATTIHVERGPVKNFAEAVTDENPVYSSVEAARDAGFDDIPAPPTFSFVAANWGKYPEDQPADPTDGSNPMMEIIGGLMKEGGMILHGEQEFTYHQPIQVGDTLHHKGEVKDFYSKESKGKTMTFLVIENEFTNEAGEPVVTETFNLIHRK